ncbi:MAG: hypothetical protein HQL32_13340, partial [Planctomycetes bacterium]|nr:hypothetical protein [Planctomycetota bacterium]
HRFTVEGRVGIGTTTPTETLDVNGTVKATAFRVGGTALNVPDYVFKKDYDLLSLQEVEEAIEELGHLPNIPSEKKIKKDGLDVSQMQMKLLEKVEELTLYMIQVNKQNLELSQEVQALKRRLGDTP